MDDDRLARISAALDGIRAKVDAGRAAEAARDELAARLDRIKDAIGGLGTVPTLAKLRALLEVIKEVVGNG